MRIYTLIWEHKETHFELWHNYAVDADDPRDALVKILAHDEAKRMFNHRLKSFSGPNMQIIVVQ
jgi:hypothetical protein